MTIFDITSHNNRRLKFTIFKFVIVSILCLCFSTAFSQNSSQSKSVATNASIGVNYAEVYEGPNIKTPIALLSKYTPVKILSKASIYSKIRDVWGNDGWVKSEDINPNDRFIITKAPITQIMKSPTSNSVLFEVTSSVAMQVIGIQGQWLQVKHFDKQIGYVNEESVLGYK